MHTLFIAPTSFGVGLTSISLGLSRVLGHARLKVGFFKPIAQLYPVDPGPERSSELVTHTHGLSMPEPLPLTQVERMFGNGQLGGPPEEITSLYQCVATDKDVVIVEDMVPTRHASYVTQINFYLAKSLDTKVILVPTPEDETFTELINRIGIQARLFDGPHGPEVLRVILNKVHGEADTASTKGGVAGSVRRLTEHSPLLRDDFRLVGYTPWRDGLSATRTRDIVDLLNVRVINAGDYGQCWVQKIVLYARVVPNTVQLLKPSVLVVTPGDRGGIILATSLTAMNGVSLTGLPLCDDFPPDLRIMEPCCGVLQGGLLVLPMATDSYDTTTNLNWMNKEVPVDDRECVERITESIVKHTDFEWLKQRYGTPREPRLSPPAFRHQVMQRAQEAGKRIVLPGGNEPCTMQAAAICQTRGIARRVLLAEPNGVRVVAQAQDIVLPKGLEIIDPNLVRQRYIESMVELRKGRELNTPIAERQLKGSVVLAAIMFTLNEVGGLVSSAIHTATNAIHPAL